MAHELLKAFPNGRSVVVATLMGVANHVVQLEHWQKSDCLIVRNDIKKTISLMQDNLKDNNKSLKKLETEALQYWDKLTNDLFNENTREHLINALTEWIAATNTGWSPAKSSAYLDQILRRDNHYSIESGGVTRAILESIAEGKHIIEGENAFPKYEGVSRGTHKGESFEEKFSHQIIPSADATKLEARHLTKQNSDLLPTELDGLFPVPDFDQRAYEATLKYQSSLSDFDSDLLMYLMAVYCEKAKIPNEVITVSINDIMEALGKHFNTSGAGRTSYRAEDKRNIRKRVEQLQNQFLTISRSFKTRPNSKPLSLESTVLKIDSFLGQEDLTGRVTDWEKIAFSFGIAWSYRLFESEYGRTLAIFQADALKYHPERELYEKRLLKRLSWYWRLNVKRTTPYKKSVYEILTSDIGISDFSKTTAEKLEQALRTLKQNGHINEWKYCNGETEISKVSTRLPNNWIESWLKREIEITTPLNIVLAYKSSLGNVPVAIDVNKPEPLSDKIKAFKLAYGFTSARIGRDLGIAKGLFSYIENGQRQASKQNETKILKYIAEHETTNNNFVKSLSKAAAQSKIVRFK
jgi:hypothetical protein